ncbi:uncharacterized protein NEMAJ01_0770 [Nematocida major]|uniref:uncharacterized protein n=1 Tax=Nematocida major TaxID=1912982 RepID=UPI002007FDBF|nr:uncharacterized protein NEMAJ01_0770 [Nematocida major]KAH9385874.1 hypothetical protein NEMAJ01_0770 [Nematocida major]
MGSPDSSKNIYRNTNRIFALDEVGSDESDLQVDLSLSLSDDLHSILEERKLYTFNGHSVEHPRYPEGMEETSHIDTWYSKKKRRPYSAPWNYIPSQKERYSPADVYGKREGKKQKLCLGVMKSLEVPQEKSTINSILPLYLNATTSFDGPAQRMEFRKISSNFLDRIRGIDYDSLTVQQLKSIMKEFGLAYTGKKHELISRMVQTCNKIRMKQEAEEKARSEEREADREEGERRAGERGSLGFMFF